MALNFVTTGFNECIGVRKPVARAMSNALTAIMDTPRSIAVQDLRSQLHVCDNRIASLEQQLYERDMAFNAMRLTQEAMLREMQALKGSVSNDVDSGTAAVSAQAEEVFASFDVDGSGDMDVKELRPALARLGLNATGLGTEAILKRYDASGDGKISLAEFRVLVRDLATFVSFDKDGSGLLDVDELRPALAKLGLSVTQAQMATVLRWYDTSAAYEGGPGDGMIGLDEFSALLIDMRAFAAFDRDGSGAIDVVELRAALEYIGIDAGGKRTANLLRRYDTDASGAIDFPEWAALARHLRVFTAHDEDGSGTIDVRELKPALKVLGLECDSQQAERILKRYDTDGNGRLDLEEFTAVARDLPALSDRMKSEGPGRQRGT